MSVTAATEGKCTKQKTLFMRVEKSGSDKYRDTGLLRTGRDWNTRGGSGKQLVVRIQQWSEAWWVVYSVQDVWLAALIQYC